MKVSVQVLQMGGDAQAVVAAIAEAGHTTSEPLAVDAAGLEAAVLGASGSEVVVIVGGTDDLCRATLESGRVVFRLPADPTACDLAVSRVVLPGLSLWAAQEELDLDEPVPFQSMQRQGMGVAVSQDASNAPEEETEGTPAGWLRAVQTLEGTLEIGKVEALPIPIETLSPVINVLDTAGERGVMTLPNGRRFGVYGWPDLRRSSSKVLAVGWGDPLAEVLALHRHPHEVGTVIVEGGVIARSDSAEVAERVTGRRPPSDSGVLFAVSGEAVWILRGSRVIRWDGQRERDEGSPKQVLASLTLHWSNR